MCAQVKTSVVILLKILITLRALRHQAFRSGERRLLFVTFIGVLQNMSRLADECLRRGWCTLEQLRCFAVESVAPLPTQFLTVWQ